MIDRALQVTCDNFVSYVDGKGYKFLFYNSIAGAGAIAFELTRRGDDWANDWLNVNLFNNYEHSEICLCLYVGGEIDDLYYLGDKKVIKLLEIRKDLCSIVDKFNSLKFPADLFMSGEIGSYFARSLNKFGRQFRVRK